MKIKEFMKITIVGAGYVGLSLSALLSRGNNVVLVDTDQDKTDQINKRTVSYTHLTLPTTPYV